MLSVFKCQFGWTVLRRTGESNPSGCKQPSNASQACPVPTPGVSSEAAPATRWLYQTFRMDLCDIHHQSSNSVPDLGSRQMFGRECRREGTRNRALVFLARIEILSRRQNPHPSKTAKGGATRHPLLKHDLLKQFRTDDFAYLLALFCDLLRLLFAAHDLVTHRLAFCGQAVHGSMILVFDRKSKVPILRASGCFLEEDLVIDDRSRTFFLLE